jgi:cobaltochelatase CobN
VVCGRIGASWAHLGRVAIKAKKTALILANYPNKDGRLANGVGLDTPASCVSVLKAMKKAGYDVGNAPETSADLMDVLTSGVTNSLAQRQEKAGYEQLSHTAYTAEFAKLPVAVRTAVEDRWGKPQDDPHVIDGTFPFGAAPVRQSGCRHPTRAWLQY